MTSLRFILLSWLFVLRNFIDSWFASIPWRRFVFAGPFVSLVLLVMMAYCLGDDLRSDVRKRLLAYQTERAKRAGDWATAKLLLSRRERAEPGNDSLRFELAKAHQSLGESEFAAQIVHALVFAKERRSAISPHGEKEAGDAETEASSDRSPATANLRPPTVRNIRFRSAQPQHLAWMIDHVYQAKSWEQLSPRDRVDCVDMLQMLHTAAPQDTSIAQRYADRLLLLGRYPEALPVLVSLIPTAPGIGLRAAIIARKLGQQDRAIGYASQSRDQFDLLVRQHPGSAELAVSLARCLVFLGDHVAALASIDRVLSQASDSETRATLLGIRVEAIVAWADAVQAAPNTPIQDRLQLLDQLQVSLRHAPNHPQMLQLIVSEVLALDQSGNQSVADSTIALINGIAPELGHFIRGTAAAMQGRPEEARIHLELAAKAYPDSDVILNNLAHVISETEGGDLEAALALANTAIDRAETLSTYHHDTRGRILYKLGRWQEAISDLQIAIKERDLARQAHEVISDCYHQLGLGDLAKLHAQAAQQIR